MFLAVLAVVVGVAGTGVTRWPGYGDDEGTYVAEAWAVLHGQGLSHYTYWYDHPPLGWLQLAALRGLAGPLLGGMPAVAAGRLLMLVPLTASYTLLWAWARRLGLRAPAAAGAVLLLGLSPLAVAFLRSVYLDGIALPWVLAAFFLAATPRSRLWSYAGSGACFAVAVLSKETMLLVLPALLVQIWHTCDRRTRPFCVTAFGCVLAAIGLTYPLYAGLKKELLPGPGHVSLLSAVAFQLGGRTSTGTPLNSSSASAGLVHTWLALDPWLLGMGVIAAPVAYALKRGLRPPAVALGLLVVAGLRPGYLPEPYVVMLLPMAAVVVAGLIDAAVGPVRVPAASRGQGRRLRPAVVLVLTGVLIIAGLAPAWSAGLHSATTTSDATGPTRAAVRYLTASVDPHARVMVDDTFYVDLVQAGFTEQTGVVWFYKIDRDAGLDPSVIERLPRGWRELDYVVSSPALRAAVAQQPNGLTDVRAAVQASTVMVTFGSGEQRVEIRRLRGPGLGSGALSGAG